MAQNESLSRPVDWPEILGGEISSPGYAYVLPRRTEVVAGYVAIAVFGTLIGRDMLDRKVIAEVDAMHLLDERDEEVVHDLFGMFRDLMESQAYEKATLAEALTQGEKAADRIRGGRSFEGSIYDVYYDRWGLIQISEGVYLHEIEGYRDYIRLTCALPKIMDIDGFPRKILSRSLRGVGVLQAIKNIAGQFGRQPEAVIQEMLDIDAGRIFIDALNAHRERDPYPWQRTRRRAIHEVRQRHLNLEPLNAAKIYPHLRGPEKEYVAAPRKRKLNTSLGISVESGTCSANFLIDTWLHDKTVRYNPDTNRMEVVVMEPNQHDVHYAKVYPEITPATTHADLLNLRERVVQLANQLGFTPPNRLKWD